VRNLITDVPGVLVGNARAVARGVYEAMALPHANAVPDDRTRFGPRPAGA